MNRRGFTLLELLIVISIIAILSVIVILVLNPSEMLKKARDSQRTADLNTIKTTLGLYMVGTNVPYLGLNGTSNTGCSAGSRYIWFSKSGVSGIVDTNATATSSASQSIAGKTNGTGWIPVNLSSLSGGSPISSWPVDPVNSVANLSAPSATDLVYRYSCNSATQFEVDASLESIANAAKLVADGGDNPTLYEAGTNLTVINSPSGPSELTIIDRSSGFTNFSGINVQGSSFVPQLNGSALRFMGGFGSDSASVWAQNSFNPQTFTSDFTINLPGIAPNDGSGDGFAFALQNSSNTIYGGSGSRVGLLDTPGQVAIVFDIYPQFSNIALVTGAVTGDEDVNNALADYTPPNVDLHGPNPISVHIEYDGTNLTAKLTDTVTSNFFTKTWTVDIPSITGSPVWAGFTGGEGGAHFTGDLLSWKLMEKNHDGPLYDTIGEVNVLPDNDSGNGNLLLAQQALLSQAGTIQSLSFYVTSPAGQLRLGVYDASGPSGGPGVKIAETAEITPVAGWNTSAVLAPVVLAPGTYWLAYFPSDSSLSFKHNWGAGNFVQYSLSYGPMPATFPTPFFSGPDHWSFFGTLTP